MERGAWNERGSLLLTQCFETLPARVVPALECLSRVKERERGRGESESERERARKTSERASEGVSGGRREVERERERKRGERERDGGGGVGGAGERLSTKGSEVAQRVDTLSVGLSV